ncbi:hypothetical protein K435DRAFT_754585 [Dendrothele bispora CBS 962.96]|uniref:F-box domain-containing protein n=1 Tax=Dendrothele bispora (strain CBS 962.96) TaxID=1314807 RepID=A0A4S8M3Q3_DENBC|nr:hypothetical protein K435DRAFT_754585 [Dendrothele bispora CBS 962.96]
MPSPATRKSSRLAERAQAAAAATTSTVSTNSDSGSSTSTSPPSVDGQPKRKRARISYNYESDESEEAEQEDVEAEVETSPRFRGNRGKLEKLTEIPLDVLFEIFGYLTPFDILKLARTTKDLRRLLMDKSSTSVWQAARSNVPGLPPPMTGMSEPEYANLAFDAHCHTCHSLRCENIIWRFRTRLCNKCLPLVFTPTEELSAPDFMPNQWQFKKIFGHRLLDCLPYIKITPGKEPFRTAAKGLPFDRAFIQTLVDRLLDEYEVFKEDDDTLALWISLKAEIHHNLQDEIKVYEAWHSERLATRSQEIEKTRLRRRTAILERLSEQGWEEEVKFVKQHRSWDFNNHKLVNQPKDLTERIWKNIEEPLTHFMEEMRILRIRRNCRPRYNVLRKAYPQYVDLQDPDLPTPIIGDILTLDLVKSIAEIPSATETDLPEDDIFDPLLELLPTISHIWLSTVQTLLVLIAQRVKPDFQPSDLKLATSVFQCSASYCKERMSHDLILKHSCATSPRFSSPGGRRSEQFNGMSEDASWFGAVPWNEGGDRVRFDLDGSKRVKLLVRYVLGLDPAETTVEELDKGNYAIECTRCRRKGTRDKKCVMRWQKALNHGCKVQHLAMIPKDGPEYEAFLKAENEVVFDSEHRGSWGWGSRPVQKAISCTHEGCSQRFSYEGFRQHLFDVYVSSCRFRLPILKMAHHQLTWLVSFSA